MSDLKATSLMSQLGDGVTDRDALRKKFFNLDRKVKVMNEVVTFLKDKDPEPDVGMFTKNSMTKCASCEKGIVNLLTGAAEH